MSLPVFLCMFSLLTALVLFFVKNHGARAVLVSAAAVIICLASAALLISNYNYEVRYFDVKSSLFDRAVLLIEIGLAAYIIYLGIRFKRYTISLLALIQSIIMISLKFSTGISIEVANDIFIDRLSIIMSLIIGVAGSLIAVYSIGYMKDYHAREPQVRPRINFFFFIVFLFLSAMFGLVFSNNLIWIYFFWEITTFCSFLLIGYSESDEARANAFRALEYNLLGGVAFAAAIFFLCWKVKIIELDRLMALNKMFLMVPVALIGLAGITKSAQFPFSSWLLGAMVAPTPVSALLHSSTMVKAGVYIVLRFALILDRTLVGYALALIGGISFLASSLMAVSQDNAKRALAHSTIANLGLVMMCAGIGTPEAVWAGILLMIFHAFTKGLLFLCVGIFEDKMHSRAIEDMSGLTMAMPRLSVMMQVGMAGMFLAPFGMLVSKWAVIKALVDFNPVLTVFVVFGSAATVLLWVKWMGRLIVVTAPLPTIPTSEVGIGCSVWLPLWTLTILAVMLIALFPCVSEVLIAPYIAEVYNTAVRMGHDNVAIMSVMLVLVMLFPLGLLKRSGKVRVVSPYLGGANTPDGGGFYGATDAPQGTLVRSYYFEKYFSEERLFGVSEKICFWLAAIMLMIALI